MTDYTKVGWQDEPSTATPVNAANLDKMDTGIDTAHTELDAHTGATTAHSATAAATASRIPVRDTAGKFLVGTTVTADAAGTVTSKGYVDTADAARVAKVGTAALRIHPAATTFPADAVSQDGDWFVKLP